AFVDLMFIDKDTFTFLRTVLPSLAWTVVGLTAVAVPLLVVIWWYDLFRVRRISGALGLAACLAALAGLSVVAPKDPHNDFIRGEYVSKFARSGASAIAEYVEHGLLDAAAQTVRRLRPAACDAACHPAAIPPHLV